VGLRASSPTRTPQTSTLTWYRARRRRRRGHRARRVASACDVPPPPPPPCARRRTCSHGCRRRCRSPPASEARTAAGPRRPSPAPHRGLAPASCRCPRHPLRLVVGRRWTARDWRRCRRRAALLVRRSRWRTTRPFFCRRGGCHPAPASTRLRATEASGVLVRPFPLGTYGLPPRIAILGKAFSAPLALSGTTGRNSACTRREVRGARGRVL